MWYMYVIIIIIIDCVYSLSLTHTHSTRRAGMIYQVDSGHGTGPGVEFWGG